VGLASAPKLPRPLPGESCLVELPSPLIQLGNSVEVALGDAVLHQELVGPGLLEDGTRLLEGHALKKLPGGVAQLAVEQGSQRCPVMRGGLVQPGGVRVGAMPFMNPSRVTGLALLLEELGLFAPVT